MDKGLFDALFNDNETFFKLDGKKLNDSLEKYKGKGSASKAMFGGLELFEGKVPDNLDDSAATLDSLREGGAGPAGGAPAGGRTGETGDPKVEEGTAAGGTATVAGGKDVAGVAKAKEGDVEVAGVVHGKDVKEGTAGVAKTPSEKETAGVTKAQDGDVKVGAVVKEEVGAEKVLGEFTDELTAKALKDKTQDSEISNYKDKDGKDVWKVSVKSKPGMAEKVDESFDKAMSLYKKTVSEARKKIKEEKDPLNAMLTALKSTIQNMLNFYAAGDMTQAVEYANLSTKQSADIGANLQTMKAAEEAANGVHNGGAADAAVPAMDAPIDAAAGGEASAAQATADSIPTSVGDTGMDASEGEPAMAPEPEEELESKKTVEGKVPTNAPDDSKETLDQLYEKKVQECAEKAYLVLKLKEKKDLNEKEKAFIEAVEKEVIEDKLRADAKVFLEKMLQSPKTTKEPMAKDKEMNKKMMKDQEKELKAGEKKG